MPDVGVPHDYPDSAEPGVFTGTDSEADVGEPNDLGAVIGTETGVIGTETSAIGIPHP